MILSFGNRLHSKKHGKRWRKRWEKLHLGVDENGRILAFMVTDGHEHDSSQVPNLLAQVDREIDRFVGEGIYDHEGVYEAVDHHSPGAEVVVPPGKDTVFFNNPISIPSHRDRHIVEIRSKGWSDIVCGWIELLVKGRSPHVSDSCNKALLIQTTRDSKSKACGNIREYQISSPKFLNK